MPQTLTIQTSCAKGTNFVVATFRSEGPTVPSGVREMAMLPLGWVKNGGIKYLSSCTGEKKSIQNSIFAFSVDKFLFWDPAEPQKWFIRVAWCNIYYPLSCQEAKEGNLVACYHST